MTRPQTKILVDGGDPHETQMVKELIRFVDGQTTNPSLIAKNLDIIRLVQAGHKLTEDSPRASVPLHTSCVSPLAPIL